MQWGLIAAVAVRGWSWWQQWLAASAASHWPRRVLRVFELPWQWGCGGPGRRPRSKGRDPSLRRERRQILGDPTLRFRDLPGDLPGSPRAHPDTGSADGPRISGGAATSDGGRVGRRL